MHPTSILSRRQMLRLSALGGAGLVAACTTTHGGGITTATIDVATVVTDSQRSCPRSPRCCWRPP